MAKRNTYFQDEEVKKKIDMKQFGKIVRYMIPYSHFFVMVILFMLISAAASIVAPYLLKHIVNDIAQTKEIRDLILQLQG